MLPKKCMTTQIRIRFEFGMSPPERPSCLVNLGGSRDNELAALCISGLSWFYTSASLCYIKACTNTQFRLGRAKLRSGCPSVSRHVSLQLVCNRQSVSRSLKKYALCSGRSSFNLQNTAVTCVPPAVTFCPQSVSSSKQCLSSYRVTITLCLSVCRSFAWKQNENLSCDSTTRWQEQSL